MLKKCRNLKKLDLDIFSFDLSIIYLPFSFTFNELYIKSDQNESELTFTVFCWSPHRLAPRFDVGFCEIHKIHFSMGNFYFIDLNNNKQFNTRMSEKCIYLEKKVILTLLLYI